ncbi:hypothetical protein [Sphingomonas sp. PP-CC-3A-396]|uniref:hypothetical protein n=1 Tax=Sphingomonas sp. PP-CC-3A-396 TaxID=2135655 RepID=UPI0010DE4CBB|nr:hypothetical protein [Sphingomonas sp. PP-CC-3A-396]TCQ03872.1 hypothetical protein C8J40_1092 [Sphingomonas sp. PP-CC-3A-396]
MSESNENARVHAATAGRIFANGWPTGGEVALAMLHDGDGTTAPRLIDGAPAN